MSLPTWSKVKLETRFEAKICGWCGSRPAQPLCHTSLEQWNLSRRHLRWASRFRLMFARTHYPQALIHTVQNTLVRETVQVLSRASIGSSGIGSDLRGSWRCHSLVSYDVDLRYPSCDPTACLRRLAKPCEDDEDHKTSHTDDMDTRSDRWRYFIRSGQAKPGRSDVSIAPG